MDDKVYRLLEMNFPREIRGVIDCFANSPCEFIAEFEDGTKKSFDIYTDRRRILPDSYDDLTEEQWSREFSYRFRRLMWQYGVNQLELSERTGISTVTLSHYATGRRIPNFMNMDKIAKALGCSTDYFRYSDINRDRKL